jgi:DUF4097 and DUF4098 domain-containing protein YvlB
MKKSAVLIAAAMLVVLALSATIVQADERFEFSGVTKIKFEGTSGDIGLRQSDNENCIVELRSDVYPARNFRPEVEQDGQTVYIEERWRRGNSQGDIQWTIYLPAGKQATRITVSTASGSLDCRDVTARFKFNTASGQIDLTGTNLIEGSSFNTASGDIILEDMTVDEGSDFSTASGDVFLDNLTIGEDCGFSTASGDVRATECNGFFDLSTASGDVVVKHCDLSGYNSFSSASGDVLVVLDKLPADGLRASTASGKVVLDVAEFGDNFTLVMVKREDRGRISCPFDYTSEDVFEEHDQYYEEKIVERGSGKPEIVLRTASGSVVVRD